MEELSAAAGQATETAGQPPADLNVTITRAHRWAGAAFAHAWCAGWAVQGCAGRRASTAPAAGRSRHHKVCSDPACKNRCNRSCSMQVESYMVASNGQVADSAAAITAFEAEDLQGGYTT